MGEKLMTGRRRSTSQIVRDRRRIADLYLQGETQTNIAVLVKLSRPTVTRDLAALRDEWRASALIDIDEAKARSLAKVDRLEREYWTAWARSCEDAETVRMEGKPTGEGEEGAPEKVVKTSKGQAGDPRFLAGVMTCIERRCKIIGVDAPTKNELTAAGGGPLSVRFVMRPDDPEDTPGDD